MVSVSEIAAHDDSLAHHAGRMTSHHDSDPPQPTTKLIEGHPTVDASALDVIASSSAARTASVQLGPRGSRSMASDSIAACRARRMSESAWNAVLLASVSASASSVAFSAAICAPASTDARPPPSEDMADALSNPGSSVPKKERFDLNRRDLESY